MNCLFQDVQTFPGHSASGLPALQKPEKTINTTSYTDGFNILSKSMLLMHYEVSELWMTRPSLQGSIYGVFIMHKQRALKSGGLVKPVRFL